MRRVIAACAVAALVFTGCGKKLPDEGTIEACGLTIGVAMPGVDSEMGAPTGWKEAADKAASSAKNDRVHRSALALQAALAPLVKTGKLSDPELARYAAAAKELDAACKASRAFDDKRFHEGPQ